MDTGENIISGIGSLLCVNKLGGLVTKFSKAWGGNMHENVKGARQSHSSVLGGKGLARVLPQQNRKTPPGTSSYRGGGSQILLFNNISEFCPTVHQKMMDHHP